MRLVYLPIFILSATCNLAQAEENDPHTFAVLSKKKNKDASEVILKKSNQSELIYEVLVNQDSKERKKLSLSGKTEDGASPFYAVTLIDFDKDGYWDAEESGACGNKVCAKVIYRFDPIKKEFFRFFSGAYNKVQVFDGYLIEGGGSGCCAFEQHAYKIQSMSQALPEKDPDWVINTTNLGVCSFARSDGKFAPPPNKKWLSLCETYGKHYKLKTR